MYYCEVLSSDKTTLFHKIEPLQFFSLLLAMDVSHHREPGTASAPFFPLMFYILNKTLETLFVALASCAILGDDNKNS